MKLYLTTLILMTVPYVAAGASENLVNIDRRIKKEPSYSSRPLYALLVFGPEAKRQAWLVVDGETLYVDRNGNGDLTEPDERVELDMKATEELKLAPGSSVTKVNVFDIGVVAGHWLKFDVWIRKPGYVETSELFKEFQRLREENGWENATLWRSDDKGEAQNPVLLCPRPEEAQISHLGGPLTFKPKWDERQSLSRPRAGVLDVAIGTHGLKTKNSKYSVFSPLTIGEVPTDVHPFARLEFPNKAEGGAAIPLEVTLDQRCCGDTFYSRVEVPEGVGHGKAKVTVAFPDWPEGEVAPATFEVALE